MTESRPADDPEASGRILFVVALLAGALLRLIQLGNPDLFGADEGLWAVGARNIVEGGIGQLLGLSHLPLGEPSGTPILFPALLSTMVRVFGPVEWAIRLPSAMAGLLSALLLERIVRRGFGQPAGHLAGAFAALFPPLVAASRSATVEPTLTALGLIGLIFGIRAFEEDLPREASLAGLAFGLGFLAKGYAVGLFMAPLAAAIVLRPGLFRIGRTRRSLTLLLGTFAAVGGSQLIATAILRPALLSFQLGSSFGVIGSSSWSFDPALLGAELKAIVRTIGLFLPLIGAGVAFLLRPRSDREIDSGATGGERRIAHGALWTVYAIELLLLVIVNGNFQLSSAPVIPVLAGFAGFGATALFVPLREPDTARTETRFTLVAGAVALLTAAILFELGNLRIERGGDPTFGLPVVLIGIAIATLASALLARGVRSPSPLMGGRATIAFVAAFLVFAGVESARVIRQGLLTHRTGARELAFQIEPLVAPLPVRTVAFHAPEPDALAFRLFRTGLGWSKTDSFESVQREAQGGTVRCWAYVEGAPAGEKAPPMLVRAWLAEHMRDVTSEVDARAGRPTGMRVFVPRPVS